MAIGEFFMDKTKKIIGKLNEVKDYLIKQGIVAADQLYIKADGDDVLFMLDVASDDCGILAPLVVNEHNDIDHVLANPDLNHVGVDLMSSLYNLNLNILSRLMLTHVLMQSEPDLDLLVGNIDKNDQQRINQEFTKTLSRVFFDLYQIIKRSEKLPLMNTHLDLMTKLQLLNDDPELNVRNTLMSSLKKQDNWQEKYQNELPILNSISDFDFNCLAELATFIGGIDVNTDVQIKTMVNLVKLTNQ